MKWANNFSGKSIFSSISHTDTLMILSSLSEPPVLCSQSGPSETREQTPRSPLWSLSRHQSPPEPPPAGRFSSSEDARLVCSDREGREGEKGVRIKVFIKAFRKSFKADTTQPSSKDIPPISKTLTLGGFQLSFSKSWRSEERAVLRGNVNFCLSHNPWPACTHLRVHAGACSSVCVCIERERQQWNPPIPSACGPCESVVGGDSPALDSCAPRWCASLMTNQPALWFLQLWTGYRENWENLCDLLHVLVPQSSAHRSIQTRERQSLMAALLSTAADFLS